MPDFNKVLNPGNDVDNGEINVVVEIPKGSMLKIEWNRELAAFEPDRVEPGIFAKPVNYGFIPRTLDEDGDELDVLLVTAEGVPTGVFTKAKVIGIVNFNDDDEMDHKVVAVPADDRHYGDISSIDELGNAWKNQIEHHFNHYKDLKKPDTTEVLGFADTEAAIEVINECIERWEQQS